ncbi:MAG: TIGR03619 family F420-dependent LLM class oxidoreductase, partial [Deltaproteobacteria bacterium]|nr:TIGR03619 family F420-dependent LLM class oxidoreductase [Deltaproteobacteria bacterium]
LWVVDHIAIAPDDAEGSGGRYLDPLTALAWIAGMTERVGIGTAILNLPYRPPLPTAKAIASVQELSGGRLQLGVGVGWMEAEFRALGVDRSRRGRLTDEMLDFLERCFATDELIVNDQPMLFLPRPKKPPIFVGGGSDAALARAVRAGDGWMPMGGNPAQLAPRIERLRELERDAGRTPLEIIVLGGVALDDPTRAREQLAELSELGVTRLAQGIRYEEPNAFLEKIQVLAALR